MSKITIEINLDWHRESGKLINWSDYKIYWDGKEVPDRKKKRLLHQVLLFPILNEFLKDCITMKKVHME